MTVTQTMITIMTNDDDGDVDDPNNCNKV